MRKIHTLLDGISARRKINQGNGMGLQSEMGSWMASLKWNNWNNKQSEWETYEVI